MNCAETGFRTAPILECLRQIPDYRCGRKTKHDLAEMLVCVIIGFLCGRTTIRRSLNWCKNNIDRLREHMKLENGIASPATICRMLCGIDEELFLYAFMEWIGEIVDSRDTHLAVDGKALRAGTERIKGLKTPMLMNVVEAATGLVLMQFPVEDKENEITALPKVLKLLDITGSTITIDAIGTQTAVMEQIHGQGGHFMLPVEKNQPEACGEIHGFMDRLGDAAKAQPDGKVDPVLAEYLEKYDESHETEKNRERLEYRTSKICNDASELTKAQEEWAHVKSIGQICQVRIPIERDREGNDTTPSLEDFLKNGSRRAPSPMESDGAGRDIQRVAMVSDMNLTSEELGNIKRNHWSVENSLHHILDDTFREDRCPAKKSRNNLALIRKFAYNILRLAILETKEGGLFTEMMDSFCDKEELQVKYVFRGICSLY